MNDLLYLYGFVPAGAPVPPDSLRGIEQRKVELLAGGELRAVVSAIPAEQYGVARIEAGLEDLEWVAERGLAHERVVAWFVDRTEILPAALFTLYSSPAALEDTLRERGAQLIEQLQRLSGRREWDLKVSYRRAELEQHAGAVSQEVRALDQEIAEAPPGRRFLLERKRAELVKRELTRSAHQVADQLLAELQPLTDGVVPLTSPRDTAELPVLLAAALLLRREQEEPLRTLVAQRADSLEGLGFSVSITGPWAPYRFLQPTSASA